jgi:hypothetical protein
MDCVAFQAAVLLGKEPRDFDFRLRELTATQGVVERKTTIPILSNYLFEASGDKLSLTATDLDLSLCTACNAKVKEKGSCTIPARKLRFPTTETSTLSAVSCTTLPVLNRGARFIESLLSTGWQSQHSIQLAPEKTPNISRQSR